MKVRLLLPFLIMLQGCAPAAGLRPVSPDAEAAIRVQEDQERLALLNRDVETLERVWSERFAVNSPLNQVAPHRSAVIDRIRQGLIHYSSFERRIEHIRFDGDIAIVMGGETIRPTGQAPLAGRTVHRRFTHIWKLERGAWRLLARHANNLPPTR